MLAKSNETYLPRWTDNRPVFRNNVCLLHRLFNLSGMQKNVVTAIALVGRPLDNFTT